MDAWKLDVVAADQPVDWLGSLSPRDMTRAELLREKPTPAEVS